MHSIEDLYIAVMGGTYSERTPFTSLYTGQPITASKSNTKDRKTVSPLCPYLELRW